MLAYVALFGPQIFLRMLTLVQSMMPCIFPILIKWKDQLEVQTLKHVDFLGKLCWGRSGCVNTSEDGVFLQLLAGSTTIPSCSRITGLSKTLLGVFLFKLILLSL